MRLKPHEAQSYRKKALWVSWVSIAVTIILAIVAFSEFPFHLSSITQEVQKTVQRGSAHRFVPGMGFLHERGGYTTTRVRDSQLACVGRPEGSPVQG